MKQDNFRPRGLLNKEIAGICGVARLTDKARAAHAGEIGSYKYGVDSEQDTAVLAFLGISAEAFQEAAVRIDNDVKLGAWVLDTSKQSSDEISEINRKMEVWWGKNTKPNHLSERRRELAAANDPDYDVPSFVKGVSRPPPIGMMLWKILKRRNEKTFQQRDILNKEVADIYGAARLTDKARAAYAGEIGKYKYGADSKQDSGILSFLGISADAFQEAAVQHTDDARLSAWVLDNCSRSDEEISEFNRRFLFWWDAGEPNDYLPKRRSLIEQDKRLSIWDCILWLLLTLRI